MGYCACRGSCGRLPAGNPARCGKFFFISCSLSQLSLFLLRPLPREDPALTDCRGCSHELGQVLHNLHLARDRGSHTILNPAPAQLLPDFVYQDVDTLIMNETESAILAAQPKSFEGNPTDDSVFILARQFLHWGVKEAVIITLGAEGLVYATAAGAQGRIAAHKVAVVDTTAAGDTFVGAYAVQRARSANARNGASAADAVSFDIETALKFATLAASKTVQKAGAMASIPRLSEL